MLKVLLVIAILFAMLVPSKHALHMFQQNRYELKRYTQWLKNYKPDVVLPMALLGILYLFFHNTFGFICIIILLVVMGLILLTLEKNKSYIKPLVYTERVKRQIVVYTLLVLLILIPTLLGQAYFLIPLIVFFVPWLFIYLMGAITSPIEAAIRKHYMDDARRILKEHDSLKKIGITGSYGKTTTKNIIQSMIGEKYHSLMTPASFNTPNGITITIREQLKPIHQVFVCEMGADHVGDIEELVDFVQPQIGVVTSIGPQHLATFGSQENITNEKMKMIERLPKDGVGIVNYDNEFIRNYVIQNKDIKVIRYGIENEDVDYRAKDITYTNKGSSFTVIMPEGELSIQTQLLGEHNVLNILSAIACAKVLDIDDITIQKAAKNMKQIEHRLEKKTINGYTFIDDAFNANPVGSKRALDVLSKMSGKRVIVTPGMIDLGEEQDRYNREFGEQMKDKVDMVILVGKTQTKAIQEGLKNVNFPEEDIYVVDTVQEAFKLVYTKCSKEDTILLENDLPDAFNN